MLPEVSATPGHLISKVKSQTTAGLGVSPQDQFAGIQNFALKEGPDGFLGVVLLDLF